ncbi:hypothetical protein BWZ20_01170 [Winogradskyella sp. J14-2]|nr:hypothetical protein BWZ20_01170 [Winogradskyella sp. J14-2]
MLGAFAMLFMAVNCDNEPYEGEIIVEDTSCIEAIETTEIAAQNFLNGTQEDFSDLCLIYKEALLDQIEACGDEDGSLQLLADDLGTCTEEIDVCEEAIEASELARIIYESAADETAEVLCNAYKDALFYQIEVCGDDGTLLAVIEDLGNCEIEMVDVVGTWKLVSWNTDELRDLNNDGIVTNNYLDDIDCYDNETIEFNPDGTGTMFLRSTAEFTFTPTADGEDYFTECTSIMEDKTFTWTETINSVTMLYTDGTSLSLFKNGNLYTAINDAFYAQSTVDNSVITERITFVYNKL